MRVTLRPAGHILGSSVVTMDLAGDGGRRITFSGDLGRPQHPLLVPPAPIGTTDVVLVESTYGEPLATTTPVRARCSPTPSAERRPAEAWW